jgi:hypothetical protein
MIWDKSEVIFGTYWELGEHVANIVQNILWTINSKGPPLSPKEKQNGIKLKCYWKHLGNLKNILGIHWEHNGNTLRTIKIQKIQDPTSNFPQKMIWDKTEMLLGTAWKLNKHIEIHWDHGGNTLWIIIQDPPPPPNKTMWDRVRHYWNILGTWETCWKFIENMVRTKKIPKIQEPAPNFPQTI